MLFLLNYERVLAEVMELAKDKISGILAVKKEEISVWLDWDAGKVHPKFSLAGTDGVTEKETKEIQKVMADVWLNTTKPELIERLKGLSEKRHGFEEKEKESATLKGANT